MFRAGLCFGQKLAVAARARDKGGCASEGFSGQDGLHTKLKLAPQRFGQGFGVIHLQKRRAPVGAETMLWKPGQSTGEVLGAFPHGSDGNDAVYKTHGQRLGSIDGATGQNQVQRTPKTDNLGQPNGASVDQGDAEAATENAQNGGFVCDAQIAKTRQFQTTCDRIAGNCRDCRFGKPQPSGPKRTVSVGREAVW